MTDNSATVLVTGASQGIGKAVAQELARQGHSVLGVSRTKPQELLEPGSHSVSEYPRWSSLDLSNSADVVRFASSLEATTIRMLVLCAVDYGVNGRHPAATTSPEEWQRVLSTNCIGHCVLVSQLLPKLAANSGVIVNISSNVAIFPGPGRSAYAASKAGLHAMLRAVAEEHTAEQLRIYQLIPTFQLATTGIRRRRPPGYDFSAYGDPGVIAQVVSQVADASGSSISTGTYLVRPDGSIREFPESTEFLV